MVDAHAEGVRCDDDVQPARQEVGLRLGALQLVLLLGLLDGQLGRTLPKVLKRLRLLLPRFLEAVVRFHLYVLQLVLRLEQLAGIKSWP